jgi:MFS family permease
MFLLAFAVVLLTVTVPFVHVPVFARDIGLSAMGGAIAVSVTGLFALVGSIALGALSDRIGRKPAMVLALCVQVAAFLVFLVAENATLLYVGAAAFGFFYGGIASLFPALVGDLFGRAHAGAIGGFIFGGAGILGAWGPAVAGYLRDVDGDYQLAFTLCVLTASCALLLFLFLPRPRQR